MSAVDPVRLIDLLENIDGLKQEVQERMRRTEAVHQAKMLLQEDAIRTEALNRKLAELGRAFGEVRHDSSPSETRSREADLLRMPSRETLTEIAPRHVEAVAHPREQAEWTIQENRELPSGVEVPLQRAITEEVAPESSHPHVWQSQFEPAVRPNQELKPIEAGALDEYIHVITESTESAESYRTAAQRFSDASLEKDEYLHGAAEAKANYENAVAQMELVKQAWVEANEALHNSRQLIEQSTAQLNLSRSKEEAAMADLKSAQQDLTTAYQFAAVAAQRQHDAAEFFRKTNRWTINAVATSWMLLTWVAWLQARAFVPIWGPAAISALIVGLTIVTVRWSNRRE